MKRGTLNMPSEPIENIVGIGSVVEDYLNLCHTLCDQGIRDLVSYHKTKLGKQDYCFTGEYRLWVWDWGDWRVFVGNSKGICFEVRTKNETKALEYFEEYKKMII